MNTMIIMVRMTIVNNDAVDHSDSYIVKLLYFLLS